MDVVHRRSGSVRKGFNHEGSAMKGADANGSIVPGRGPIPWHASRKPSPFGGAGMPGGTVISLTAVTMDARRREPERGKPMRLGRPTTALSPLIFPAM